MKKLSCILLAVMLITAMFVSCTAEVIDPYDGLAYVTFGGPASKDLSASYEVQSYENLYWFYTAEKDDEFGKTGEASVETPLAGTVEAPAQGLGGTIGPFSQGVWNFVLTAYSIEGENKTLVYEGSVEGVKLTKSEVKSVPVSVTPQGKTGTIEFRNAFFKWNEDKGGNAKPTIKITAEGSETKYTLLSGLEETDEKGNVPLKWKDGTLSIDQSYDVPVGYYKCTVVAWVVDETSPIFEQSFGIRVYGSATTVISGDITEKVDSEVIFVPSQADLSVIKGTSKVSVDATPSNVDGHKTTIDFGLNLDADKTYSIQVETTDAVAASSKFTVSSEQAAVAGIDFNLTRVEADGSYTPVKSFYSEVVITTYIETGLTGVKVLYGDGGKTYLNSYNASTGELVFTTDHFSQYYVVSDAVASIDKVSFGTLQSAIDVAKKDNVITVVRDMEVRETVKVYGDKQITLNLNGKKIFNDDVDLEKTWSLISVRENAVLTIEGSGVLKAKENDCFAADVYDEGAKLIINNGTFIGNNHTIYVWGGDLIVNGGSFSVQRPSSNSDKYGYVLNCYDANYRNGSARIVVKGGTFDKFNPANCSAEGANTNFLAEGYGVDQNNDSYTVRAIAEDDVAISNGVLYKDFTKAINDSVSASSENCTQIEILSSEINLPAVPKKSISFVGHGKEETKIIIHTTSYCNDSILSFKECRIEMGYANYQGFPHASKLKFENCAFVGRGCHWSPDTSFVSCEFSVEEDWVSWLYTPGKYRFENCFFNSPDGEFFNVYNDGLDSKECVWDIVVKNCIFTGNVTGKEGKGRPAFVVKPLGRFNSCTISFEGENNFTGMISEYGNNAPDYLGDFANLFAVFGSKGENGVYEWHNLANVIVKNSAGEAIYPNSN